MSRSRQLLWILLPLLTLFRIFLFLRTPLDVMGNTPHDDLLLLTHAQSILEGNWLGTYCNTTLVKGVSFPLFVALCSRGLTLRQSSTCFFCTRLPCFPNSLPSVPTISR